MKSSPPPGLPLGVFLPGVNVSSDKRRHDILIKDRYWNFWIYNNQLKDLWTGAAQTGHYPYPVDIDGEGRDKILIGYSLWDHTGKQLWNRDDALHDHADGTMMGNPSPDPKAEPRAYSGGSDEGFIMVDLRGRILKQVRIGHAQSPSVGKYRMDAPGLQFATVNFWRNPGTLHCSIGTGTFLRRRSQSTAAASCFR